MGTERPIAVGAAWTSSAHCEKAAAGDSRRSEIEKMEAEIRKLTRRAGAGAGSDDEDEPARKKPKKSYLEEEMAKSR